MEVTTMQASSKTDSKQTTILVRIPFGAPNEGEGWQAQASACPQIPAPLVSEEQRGAYKKALLREIASAAGDMPGAKITRLVIAGATPHSMALDFWEELMGALEASFPGTRLAHVRFDAAPGDVDVKAMAYAVRYHSVMNLQVDVPSSDALAGEAWETRRAQIGQAIEAMGYERFKEWGFEFVPAAEEPKATTGAQAAAVRAQVEALLAFGPAYLRMVTPEGAPWDAGSCNAAGEAPASPDSATVADLLREAGYEQIRPALFAHHPKFRTWFERADDEFVSFGAGTTSHYAGMAFTTKPDVALYIDQAGRSSDIYENAAVAEQ